MKVCLFAGNLNTSCSGVSNSNFKLKNLPAKLLNNSTFMHRFNKGIVMIWNCQPYLKDLNFLILTLLSMWSWVLGLSLKLYSLEVSALGSRLWSCLHHWDCVLKISLRVTTKKFNETVNRTSVYDQQQLVYSEVCHRAVVFRFHPGLFLSLFQRAAHPQLTVCLWHSYS